MLLDEKVLLSYLPPPAYDEPPSFAAATSGIRDGPLSLSTMPPHLLLHIIYFTIPHEDKMPKTMMQEQRRILYWLNDSLRLVDRAMYITCQHFLRSTYLALYNSMVNAAFSSDPFPFLSDSSTSSSSPYPRSPLNFLQRETHILDRFIALKVREDVWHDDSLFHLERVENFKDLFDVSQPKARLEDLIRIYGSRDGLITFPGVSRQLELMGNPSQTSLAQKDVKKVSTSHTSTSSSVKTIIPSKPPSYSLFSSFFKRKPCANQQPPSISPFHLPVHHPYAIQPLQYNLLSVVYSQRSVHLLLASDGKNKTIVRVSRASRTEKLEVTARKVVQELRWYLENEHAV